MLEDLRGDVDGGLPSQPEPQPVTLPSDKPTERCLYARWSPEFPRRCDRSAWPPGGECCLLWSGERFWSLVERLAVERGMKPERPFPRH